MKVKFVTGISLILFFIFMTGVFAAGMITYYKNKDKKEASARIQDINNKLADASAANDPAISGALTVESITKHNSASDCWLIIDSNVYDVTSFIPQHPGGAGLITPYCGKEATDAFNSRGRTPPENHSSFARNLLRNYYIGPLGRVPDKLLVPGSNANGQPVVVPLAVPTLGPIKLAVITPVPLSGASGSSLVINSTEVAKHSNLQNCWLIISGGVYDITNFVTSHPGGTGVIAPYCGKDATTGFKTKGGIGSDHSSYAYSLLSNYLIANLGSSVTVSSTGGGTSTAIATFTPTPTTGTIAFGGGNPTSIPTPTTTSGTGSTGGGGGGTTGGTNLTLTTAEISTHNSLQNCWLIISGKVYDVTKFISQHPGGVTAITNWCGKESTNAFQTKGGAGSNHSSYAYSLLNNYLIGTVGSSVPVNPTSTPIPTPVPTTAGGGGASGATNTPTPTTSGGSGSCPSNIPQSICTLYAGQTVTRLSGSYDGGSWEGTVSVNGVCRHIQTNSSGVIRANESC